MAHRGTPTLGPITCGAQDVFVIRKDASLLVAFGSEQQEWPLPCDLAYVAEWIVDATGVLPN